MTPEILRENRLKFLDLMRGDCDFKKYTSAAHFKLISILSLLDIDDLTVVLRETDRIMADLKEQDLDLRIFSRLIDSNLRNLWGFPQKG